MVSAMAEFMEEMILDCVAAVSITSVRRESFFRSSSESRLMLSLRWVMCFSAFRQSSQGVVVDGERGGMVGADGGCGKKENSSGSNVVCSSLQYLFG